MPPPPLVSPVTGSGCASEPHYVHSDSTTGFFRDSHGRCIFLRGINLSSSAKTPQGQPGHQLDGFWEGAESGDVSFVNRVLDLDLDPKHEASADAHLTRLRSWGFNTLRYVVTWESIEHRGPGQYDEEFIEYTIRMLRKCKEYGFYVYLDPHQDLWSRFSGGDGAPYWTLLACGMNPRNFTVTNASVIQCEWPHPSNPEPEKFPDMIWAANYTRLAAMTLMTLFFAGKKYAPRCEIDGRNIQDYLQEHYLAAFKHLGEAIRAAGDLYDVCVIGWDSMNEPNHGLVGVEDITVQPSTNLCKIGPMPTAFEAMRLGMGIPTEVEHWKFGPLGAKKDGVVNIDPKGAKAWLDAEADTEYSIKYGWKRSSEWTPGVCIWALHGLWDPDTQEPKNVSYFRTPNGQHDFGEHHWQPHWLAWAKMVRSVHAEAIHFVLPPVFEIPPSFKEDEEYALALSDRAVLSTHFYDGLTLITKHWNWFNADAVGLIRGKYASLPLAIRVGENMIRKCFRDQLGYLRQDTKDCMGNYPTMMGEIGIPFDLDKREAYRTGNYRSQSHAMDASLNACDGTNLFNYTIWTYNAENTNQWGENWNGEDLSVWSLDTYSPQPKSLTMEHESSSSASSIAEPSTALLAAKDVSNNDSSQGSGGARAIEAFVRPYPLSVAGIPISVDFDIKSSHFTLVIEIQDGMLKEGSEDLPTEIFLPPVHYGDPTQDVNMVGHGETSVTQTEDGAVSARSSELEPTAVARKSLHFPHIPNPFHRKHKTPLSLSVNVSRGRYEVEGHVLRWYHGQETSDRDQPTRVKIEIRRRGGVRSEVVAAYGEKPPSLAKSVFDQLCPPSLSCLLS